MRPFAVAAMLGWALTSAPASAWMVVEWGGNPKVIDGDTIEIDGQPIRLAGIDAPELEQSCRRDDGSLWSCGMVAKLKLESLIGESSVSCTQMGIDDRKRVVAVCRLLEDDQKKNNLGSQMVLLGYAVDAPDPSLKIDGYAWAEQLARSQRMGIWSGSFETPSDWRKKHGPDA